MSTWRPGDRAVATPTGWVGSVRAAARATAILAVTCTGLAVLVILRLAERPAFGMARPLTPWITRAVCRIDLAIIGLRLTVRGRPMETDGALVANHSSWLDILVLNACDRVWFVAKAEVSRWPLVGWLARATGTVFIARDPRQARVQQALFEERLRLGHRLLFFPEGTSTDGHRVLPFKPTLFAAFYTHGLDRRLHIQPVTVIYRAPGGADPRVYGWWGGMEFLPHLRLVLALCRQGNVEVVFHPPVAADRFPDRKALAAECERTVRAGLDGGLAEGRGAASAAPDGAAGRGLAGQERTPVLPRDRRPLV